MWLSEFDILDPFAHELLQPSGSAVSLDATVYAPALKTVAKKAWAKVEGGTVRVWFDGTAPTSTVGIPYTDGDVFPITGRAAIKGFRCIDAVGSPKVWIQYGA